MEILTLELRQRHLLPLKRWWKTDPRARLIKSLRRNLHQNLHQKLHHKWNKGLNRKWS